MHSVEGSSLGLATLISEVADLSHIEIMLLSDILI